MKSWWHAHKALFLGVAALVAYALGVWGYALAFRAGHIDDSWLAVPFLAVRLFVLENDVAFGIWQLEAARWLAPGVISCTAIVAAGALFREQLRQYNLRSVTDHVVICGLGRKGIHLVREYRQAGRPRDVVVIELDERNEHIQSCRALGACVLVGDATEEMLLTRARVARAREVIAVCGQDRDNMRIALKIKDLAQRDRCRQSPLRCAIHLKDPHLNFLFQQYDIFHATEAFLDVTTFSYSDLAVRQLLAEHPLDYRPLAADPELQAHLVISGFGAIGQALALYAARIAHFTNLRRLKLTVIDLKAAQLVEDFQAQFPNLAEVVDLEVINADILLPTGLAQVNRCLRAPSQLPTLALCSENPEISLSQALQMKNQLDNAQLPIRLFLPEGKGLGAFFAESEQLTLFGAIMACCTPEMLFGYQDRLARIIHEDYVCARLNDPDHPEEPESRPALLPWSRLRSDFRDSNRQQADHIPVKLRAVGAAMVPSQEKRAQPTFAFTAEELELLARIEHNRWNAERWLSGWVYGPERDNARKIHPNLVPWEDLSEKVRDMDRETIRNIPRLVGIAGYGVQRVSG